MDERYLLSAHARRPFVGPLIGVMVAVLIAVTVVIPVIQDSLTAANFTGTLKTITDNIPILLGVVVLVAVAALIGFRR